MRLLKINLLAAAMVAFVAASASAYRVDFQSSAFGTTIAPGDLVTVDVIFDSEGQSDILTLGVGVLFDDSVFTYRKDLSSTTTYLLYVSSKAPYLQPATTCGGGYGSPNAGDGCNIYPTRPNQVQIDFISSGLASLQATTGTGVGQLVSLVFQATGTGVGNFAFDFDPFYGSAFDLGSGPGVLTLGPGGAVTVPEPTTAVLVGLGLVGLGFAGRRRS